MDEIELTDEDRGRLGYIQDKVNAFLDKFREMVAYDLDSDSIDAFNARAALDACVLLYAKGGVDVEGVEASARAFVKTCRRAVRQPSQPPPSYKERYANRPGNYQSGNVPRGLLKNARNLAKEAQRNCRGLYFVGETPPDGATLRDCIDGGLLPPGQSEGRLIAQDHRLAKLPKPPPYVPRNPVKSAAPLSPEAKEALEMEAIGDFTLNA